jgi:hypothetical protein
MRCNCSAAGGLVRQRARDRAERDHPVGFPATSLPDVRRFWCRGSERRHTLVLHHPFDPDILRDQIERERCNALVVPDAMLPGLCAATG